MRLISRLVLAAAFAALPAALAMASCSTGAAGVDACRAIEAYRCQVAPLCTPGFDVDRCTRYYRDACLNGIQNTTLTVDPNTLAQGCVDALKIVAACATSGGDSPCPGAVLEAGVTTCGALATTSPTACNLLLDCPEDLAACNFVAAPPDDAGTDGDAAAADATADATTDAASE